MQYKIINWVKTEKWEGALIEDEQGKQYLTSGIMKWEVLPHRNYEVVDRIKNERQFYEYWQRNFIYDKLGKKVTVRCTYTNGNTTITAINETLEGAKRYFLGNWFNFGDTDEKPYDDMQQCIKVELI